jgi:branched-chain amino acid transport system permease protein
LAKISLAVISVTSPSRIGLAIASALLQAYLPDGVRAFRDAFVFGLIILTLLLKPAGLVRVTATEERI